MPKRERPSNGAPTGFFALRTPLLPFDDLRRWGDGLEAARADVSDFEAAIARDRAVLRERLRAILGRPEVREAIFVASPSLDERLPAWLTDPDSAAGQKVELVLVRYVARMAGRATPFGLFAGCSLGTIHRDTRLSVAPRARLRRHSRLDMDFLFALTEALCRDPDVRRDLVYRPSSSLHRTSHAVRLAAPRLTGTTRSYDLVVAERTAHLDAAIDRAAEGARHGEIVDALAALDGDVPREDIEDFVTEMIDSHLLVADLAPSVTGPEPTSDLVARCRTVPALAPVAEKLEHAASALADLDAEGIGIAPDRYRAIARGLEDLPVRAELPRLFQVDLIGGAAATLGERVVTELCRAVEVLYAWSAIVPPRDRMRSFCEAFVRRYGDEEVPLLEALDEEAGIGFETSTAPSAAAEPLLAGLGFSGGRPPAEWTPRDAWLLGKLDDALRTQKKQIAIVARELEEMAGSDRAPLPEAFAIIASLAARSQEALDRGEFLVHVEGASGPSGANLLGRFCHGDAELARWVARHLRDEERRQEGAVLAEVVHLPEGRIGNVLLRPMLRDYEIPFLGRSGAPVERQLPASDLLLSIVDEQVVLRSARLGRRILPRLTTAHNAQGPRSLGVYRFLFALQHQAVTPGLQFSWGPLEGAAFLPRVTSGRAVLARARWNADRARFEHLVAARNAAARFRAAQALRSELELPRWIMVVEADHQLPIDLDSTLSVDTLAHLVKEQPRATLTELFPSPEELCAEGPEGVYVHELIVPMVRTPAPSSPRPLAPELRGPRAACQFGLGSEWLYVKLYTGAATADAVLVDVVSKAVARGMARGAVDGWFFIRFGDPQWHLRVRFHGDPERLLSEVLPELERAARSDGRVWRIEVDAYAREVDRYGGMEGVAIAEKIFQADSDAAVALAALLAESESAGQVRWRIALRGIDALLDDLGLTLDDKHAVLERARADFGRRLEATTPLVRQLGDRFRYERGALMEVMDPAREPAAALAQPLSVLRARSAEIAPHAAELLARERSGRLSKTVRELAPSFIHMWTNRLLRSAALAQELVLYDFLERLYASRRARGAR